VSAVGKTADYVEMLLSGTVAVKDKKELILWKTVTVA
jgi:hypothetical protein